LRESQAIPLRDVSGIVGDCVQSHFGTNNQLHFGGKSHVENVLIGCSTRRST